MSPTIFRKSNFRFFFFSREEERIHIHVVSPEGEAKFWIEPKIELARSIGLNKNQIKLLIDIIKENENEIRNNWKKHFGS